MSASLYIKPANASTLLEFGKNLARELGISGFTEREISNYVDGHYLKAKILGVVFKLCLTDDNDLADYPFWLHMRADGIWIENNDACEGLADLLARKLTVAGYTVARCPDDIHIGADIWRYSVKDGTSGKGEGEIQIDISKPPAIEP